MTINSTLPTFSSGIRAARSFLCPSPADPRQRVWAWRVAVSALSVAAILMAAARLGIADLGSYENAAPTPRLNSFTVSTLLSGIGALAFVVFLNASHDIRHSTASGRMLFATITASIALVVLAALCLVECYLTAYFVL